MYVMLPEIAVGVFPKAFESVATVCSDMPPFDLKKGHVASRCCADRIGDRRHSLSAGSAFILILQQLLR